MRSTPFRMFLIVFLALFAATSSLAATTTAQSSKANELKDPEGIKGLKYRLVGPAWGGRVSRIAGVPGDPNLYYFAGAASGVWKSTDGGVSWKSVWDDQPVSAIGSLAIAPSDANTIYVGTGEANIRGNVAPGDGIYKSIDAGKTWNHVWKQEGHIGTMAIHPTNSDIAFAAVLGHAFGPNPERGVYRTRDGGKSWQQVLKKDDNTGASDVAIDPSNPSVIFAGLWQVRRQPWIMNSGGPGSGLYVSRDGGDTWKQLTGSGLPEGVWGKVGVAIAPSNGRRVYALIEATEGGMFRSDDGGDTWTRVSANRLLRQRAWYYSTITINPSNQNDLWCPQVQMLHSIDGGETWKIVDGFHHGDHHDVWIDPKNPKRLAGSNDGGVDICTNGGESCFAPALPLGQFYHVSVDSRVPFNVAGAQQDIGTAQGPSRSLNGQGVRNGDWHGVGGGEAGWVVSDWSDPNIVYAGEYGGYISRYDHRTRQARNVSIYPENPSGHGGEDMKYRFQWTAPLAVSPHNAKVIYHGGNVIFRTEDGGQTWSPISPDLTRNDKSKQKWSGGPITGDNTSVEMYGTVFVIAESPAKKDLIWAGSDDGLVHLTQDGGKNWTDVTHEMTGLPEWATITMIEPSRFDAGTAYITADAHRLDNTKPYLFKTTDFGKSWKRLDGNLPQDIYLHSVREDSAVRDMLYLGTERGVAFSKDGGKTWQSLKSNLPTVAVHDLIVKDGSLAVATMGRSLYIFDHLNALREMSSEAMSGTFHLFSAPDAIRWRPAGEISDRWTGEDPAGLASIYYWMKTAPKSDVTIDILDEKGNVIKTLSSKPKAVIHAGNDPKKEEEDNKKAALSKEVGVQVASWDLSSNGADLIQDARLDAGDPSIGPLVLPGTYTVKLTVDGQSQTTTMKILPDPRVTLSEADIANQYSFAMEVRDQITRLSKIVTQLRSIRKQLQNRDDLLQANTNAAQLIKDSNALIEKIDALESVMHNPKAEVVYDILAFQGGAKLYSRLSFVYGAVTETDGVPTQGMREVFAAQKSELDGYDSQRTQLVTTDLAKLNDAAKSGGFPIVYVQP